MKAKNKRMHYLYFKNSSNCVNVKKKSNTLHAFSMYRRVWDVRNFWTRASRLDTNFWRTSVIVISIAADPSVDIEATHASLSLMPVIVDFVKVKPYQMMPPQFSLCGVYVVCVCMVWCV